MISSTETAGVNEEGDGEDEEGSNGDNGDNGGGPRLLSAKWGMLVFAVITAAHNAL